MRLRPALCIAACLALLTGAGAAAEPAKRVVSMNLCTDQLAMMLAGPGQLYSVSFIATDPRVSAMVDEAKAYRLNHGFAEEIYLMQPDLVIAGTYSSRATINMLRRLDVPVVLFDQAYSLSDVRDRIAQMGQVLGRRDAAEKMLADYDLGLAALQTDVKERPDALLYQAQGFTAGAGTLSNDILFAAGFDNAAIRAGYAHGGVIPLEVLALSDPDLLITSSPYPTTSLAEAVMDHPLIPILRGRRDQAILQDHDWVCGTPHVLRAVRGLAKVRTEMTKEEAQ